MKYDVAQKIADYIEDYGDKMTTYDRQSLNRVLAVLKDLTIDSDGNIKVGINNLRLINKVKSQLLRILRDTGYQKQVAQIRGFINEISEMQTAYFATSFANFEPPKVLKELKETAWEETKNGLTEEGITENVVNKITDIVSKGIKGGESFAEMNTAIKNELGEEGIVSRYSKVYLTDTLQGFARNYNSLISGRLNLKWYRYVGALVKTSRPMCVVLEPKEWIHESEFTSICNGTVDGETVSLAGFIPGTNKENFVNRASGYNCHHHLVAVPAESVPTRIRRKFEPDIEKDEDEQTDYRPKRKSL
jgi:hypothetical protein